MTWTVAHPILYFLPLLICLVVHIFLSAGFLLATKQGFFRFFIYLLSCWFVMGYLLIFNHGIALTTTTISLDFPNRYIRYENNYGIVRIPVEQIQAIVIEGQETKPQTIWIQSQQQVFYLDEDFRRFEEFLPLLQSVLELGVPQLDGEAMVYRVGGFTGPVDLQADNNTLRGNTGYFLPCLAIFPLISYLLAARAWLGNIRYFQLLAFSYGLPVLGLGLLFPPTFSQAVALFLYPFYPIFLSAMCLPDKNNIE